MSAEIDATNPGSKYSRLAEAKSAAIPLLNCSARRKAIPYPVTASSSSLNAAQPALLGKTDYAANGGLHEFVGMARRRIATRSTRNTIGRTSISASSTASWASGAKSGRKISDASPVVSRIQLVEAVGSLMSKLSRLCPGITQRERGVGRLFFQRIIEYIACFLG
jgi:hypothetical protein